MIALSGAYRECYQNDPIAKRWVNRNAPPVHSRIKGRPLMVGSDRGLEITRARASFADEGLARHLLIFRNGKPVYIIDHHCFSLFAWAEMEKTRRVLFPVTLVRLDRHSDGLSNQRLNAKLELDELSRMLYTPPLMNASFLEPAVRWGYFDRIIWLKPDSNDPECPGAMSRLSDLKRKHPACAIAVFPERKLNGFLSTIAGLPAGSFVADIDLDYFIAAQMSLKKFVSIIGPLLRKAAGVTIASSPDYIEQERAVSLARSIIAAI